MPAAKSVAPKYCLHKPSGRAYIRIRGCVRYIGKHGTPESLESYGRLVAELAAQSEATATSGPAPANITVVEIAMRTGNFARGTTRRKMVRRVAG